MSLWPIRLKLERSGQAAGAGPLSLRRLHNRFLRQYDFEALRTPLRARRHAGVVHEVPLDHMQLAVGDFEFQYVRFNKDAVHLGSDVVYGNIRHSTTLRRVCKKLRP